MTAVEQILQQAIAAHRRGAIPARQGQADFFLDTLPCNAHTTASDALWAGLPVLTCAGETFAGRVAGSIVTTAGLPELVATSLPAYESLALALARNPGRLRHLRDTLRRDRAALFDMAAYTRNLEALFTRIAEIQRAGSEPTSFAL
jgi:protein O-GlcNAc transferase